jgi:hypothetical protein
MKHLKNVTSRPTAQEHDSTSITHHYGKQYHIGGWKGTNGDCITNDQTITKLVE